MEQNVYDRGIVNLGNLARFAKVMKRAAKGEPITVGFLGGSITQDSSATKHENCYAYRTFMWWRKNFPNAEITYVNAGIGATNSQFGVARVEEDLLSKNPDVVYCEFSVNDSNTEFFKETFEGLCRQILSFETKPALFLTFNALYDSGESAQEMHETIALHYDLPCVSVRDSIVEEIRLGNLDRLTITADNLHPNDLGHQYLSELIINCTQLIYEKVSESNKNWVECTLPNPKTLNRYGRSRRLQQKQNDRNEGVIRNCGFTLDNAEQNGVRDIFKNGFEAGKCGAEITFRVNAAKISVQYRKTIRKPAPVACVLVDGKQTAVLDANFEETWGDCLFLQDIYEDVTENEHEVTIRIVTMPEESQTGFYFVSLILV